MINHIEYKDVSRYKYELVKDYDIYIDILCENIETDYIVLDQFGLLTIKTGYRWDGPTFPAIDTKNFMRGSLVHDSLYQLMREGHIDIEHRNYADRLLQSICKADGMCRLRAWWVYQAVDKFGKSSAKKGAFSEKKYRAP